jgi:hypothetical protein
MDCCSFVMDENGKLKRGHEPTNCIHCGWFVLLRTFATLRTNRFMGFIHSAVPQKAETFWSKRRLGCEGFQE